MLKNKEVKEFLYGTAYYAEGHPFIYYRGIGHPSRRAKPEYLTDLKNIKQSGLNTIRVCEQSWSIIEPEPDTYDFELYDKVLDECAKLGLYVIMGVDTLNPPEWLFEMYPDAWLINDVGQRAAGGGWPVACFSSPGFRERSAKYTENFVKHYKDHPTIVAYQLDNEPDHIPRRQRITGQEEFYCYCANCLDGFKRWLKKKYGENAPYIPEPFPEFEFCPPWLWVEWRLFNAENIVNKIRWGVEQIKKWDKVHPITTNIMMQSAFTANMISWDHDTWGLAEVLDEMGMDYYSPLNKKGDFEYNIEDSAAYSLARSQAENGKFHCLEIQPTTLEGRSLCTWDIWKKSLKGIRKAGDPGIVRIWTWRPIANGAKSVTYWVWKSQIHTQFDLVRPDGSFSEYVSIVKDISDKIKKVSPFIIEAKPYPSDVAILYSKRTIHFAYRYNMADLPIQAMLGAFAALWENRIQVDFVDVDRAIRGYLSKYKACFAPSLYVVEKELVNSFKSFVENGGHLFTDALSGSFDEKMEYSIVPCNHMDELMSYRSHMTLLEDKPELTISKEYWSKRLGEAVPGGSYVEEIEPLKGAEILAKFKNGNPAAVLARTGKGETLHVGTDLAGSYFLNKEPAAAGIFVDFAKKAGAKPLVTVSNLKPEESKKFEVTLLRNAKSQTAFLINSNPCEVHPRITFSNMPKNAQIMDAFTGRELSLVKYSEFDITVEPYDLKVLVIK